MTSLCFKWLCLALLLATGAMAARLSADSEEPELPSAAGAHEGVNDAEPQMYPHPEHRYSRHGPDHHQGYYEHAKEGPPGYNPEYRGEHGPPYGHRGDHEMEDDAPRYPYKEKPYDEYYGGGTPDYPKSYPVYPSCPECPFCPANLTECTGQCLDTKNSIFSCGSCGKVCQDKAVCTNGTCTCFEGFTDCGGVCVDLSNNVNYCGACDIACNATTQICQPVSPTNGTCVNKPVEPPCPEGESQCFGAPGANGCVNLQTSDQFCGACNRDCTTLINTLLYGGKCTNGKCCKPLGEICLLDPNCCGWDYRNLLPNPTGIPFGTARCQAPRDQPSSPLPRCCLDVNAGCGSSDDCCTGLDCTELGRLGKSCQKRGCIPPMQSCAAPGAECCSGLKCVSAPILGKICSIINVP